MKRGKPKLSQQGDQCTLSHTERQVNMRLSEAFCLTQRLNSSSRHTSSCWLSAVPSCSKYAYCCPLRKLVILKVRHHGTLQSLLKYPQAIIDFTLQTPSRPADDEAWAMLQSLDQSPQAFAWTCCHWEETHHREPWVPHSKMSIEETGDKGIVAIIWSTLCFQKIVILNWWDLLISQRIEDKQSQSSVVYIL